MDQLWGHVRFSVFTQGTPLITFTQGDLFDSAAEAWINTVNCVGVMGRGIALQFKKRFPMMFKSYHTLCTKSGLKPGTLHVWSHEADMCPRIIINFPTKTDWRLPSEYVYITSGLTTLLEVIKHDKIKSLAMPALGCSNGQLSWPCVKAIIEKWHKDNECDLAEVEITIYEPLEGVK